MTRRSASVIKVDVVNVDSYQEVFLKSGNSGAAAGKEERAIET